MTGYGKAEASLTGGKLTVEIRTLNGKSADINIKTSLLPKDKELMVRQKLAERLHRGTIDFFLNFEANAAGSARRINADLAAEYFRQIAEIGDHQIHAIHIFIGETDTAVHHDHVLAVFQNGDVFSDFIQTAQRDNFQFFCQIKYSFQYFCPKMDKTTKQPLSGKTDPESPHPEKNACISYVRSSGEDRSF